MSPMNGGVRVDPSQTRLGNLWVNRDQEFCFGDGRLVLRGVDTPGAAEALEVLFPASDSDVPPPSTGPTELFAATGTRAHAPEMLCAAAKPRPHTAESLSSATAPQQPSAAIANSAELESPRGGAVSDAPQAAISAPTESLTATDTATTLPVSVNPDRVSSDFPTNNTAASARDASGTIAAIKMLCAPIESSEPRSGASEPVEAPGPAAETYELFAIYAEVAAAGNHLGMRGRHCAATSLPVDTHQPVVTSARTGHATERFSSDFPPDSTAKEGIQR